MWAAEKKTSKNVFQRLGGDSQPKGLSEVFRNYEASEEVEDKEAKMPKWVELRPPQPSYVGGDVRIKEKILNPVMKKNYARLRRKWYVIRKYGRPVMEMGAYMIRRVQRQHKVHMNSLKIPAASGTSENVTFEKVPHRGRNQLHWKSKKEVEKANNKTEGEENHVPQSPHPGKYKILRRT